MKQIAHEVDETAKVSPHNNWGSSQVKIPKPEKNSSDHRLIEQEAINDRILALEQYHRESSLKKDKIKSVHQLPEPASAYLSQRSKEERETLVNHLQALMNHKEVSQWLPSIRSSTQATQHGQH